MYKHQPFKSIAAFAITPLAVVMAGRLYLMSLHSSFTVRLLVTTFAGAAIVSAITGLGFWVGLGFSHQQPKVRYAILFGLMPLIVAGATARLSLQPTSQITIMVVTLFAVSLLLGVRWQPGWANNSFNPTAEVGPN